MNIKLEYAGFSNSSHKTINLQLFYISQMNHSLEENKIEQPQNRIKKQSHRNIIRTWIQQTRPGKMLLIYKFRISKELPNFYCSKL
jgi:hypothetical protein